MSTVPPDGVRRAELMAALSLASDLGMGQPLERGLRGCLVALHLGRSLGVDDATLAQTYALALLRFVGCTADSHSAASFFDDELTARVVTTPLIYAPMRHSMSAMMQIVAGDSFRKRAINSALLMATGPARFRTGAASHCEVATFLARRLGFAAETQHALWYVFERWDGKGFPRRVRGEEIPLAARIVHVAYDAAAFHHLGGDDAVVTVARERAGRGYDPAVVDALCRRAADCLGCLSSPSVWDDVVGIEPGSPIVLERAELDQALEVVADFADLKSLYTPGHSRAVADLAARAAEGCRLPAGEVAIVRRAGLVHDLGRVAVSVHVWDKPGPLSRDEQERARLHPYYTERVLTRPAMLSGIGRLASMHHERLDGSGYHRGVTDTALPPSARVLAAADAYQAMTEPRPYRPAHPPEAAARALQEEVRTGRLDGDAVRAVLACAGHRMDSRPARPAGLSDREVEVLRLLARGLTARQIGRTLGITPKTADSHIQHIYTKAGVSTRAAATLFAVEAGLLPRA